MNATLNAALSGIDWSVLAPAFLAGLLVLATHVPLGIEVLKRGIIFIDLAIAQMAALGVIAAHLMGWEGSGLAVQGCAALAALCGAVLLSVAERLWPEMLEALIGLSFVLAASIGILLLAGNPHGGEHLKDLLAGQILWVTSQQLVSAAIFAVLVLALWFGVVRRQTGHVWVRRGGFYLLFALTVTVSVQLVGVYLVFASLIAPAVATYGQRHLSNGQRLFRGYVIGMVGYATGLLLSTFYDLPSGAAIVCAMCALALASVLLGGRKPLNLQDKANS